MTNTNNSVRDYGDSSPQADPKAAGSSKQLKSSLNQSFMKVGKMCMANRTNQSIPGYPHRWPDRHSDSSSSFAAPNSERHREQSRIEDGSVDSLPRVESPVKV